MPACAVKWCGNHTSSLHKSSGVTFHAFPKNPIQCKKWRNAVRIERRERDWRESYHSRLCSLHFSPEDFIVLSENGNRLLTKTAVPICTMSSAFYSPDVYLPENNNLEGRGRRIKKVKKKPPPPTKKKNEVIQDQNQEQKSQKEVLKCASCLNVLNPKVKKTSFSLEGQAREIVANVYHYLVLEYKELDKKYGKDVDIAPLRKFRERTSNATGIGLHTVTKILKEHRHWYDTVWKFEKKLRKTECKNKIYTPCDSELDIITDESDDTPPEQQQNDADAVGTQNQSDIQNLEVRFDDVNANNLSMGNEPAPAMAVSVIMTEEDYYKAHNVDIQSDDAHQNNGVHTMESENVEIEFHNMDNQVNTIISQETSIEPHQLVTTEPIYCGMDTMNTVIAQPNITTLEGQPLVTSDQLYCSMAPTISANAISISQTAVPIETQQLMPMEAQQLIPMDAQQLMPMDAQQLMPMDAQQLMPMDAQQLIPMDAQQLMPIEARALSTAEAQYITGPTGEMDHLGNIQRMDFTPGLNYYVII